MKGDDCSEEQWGRLAGAQLHGSGGPEPSLWMLEESSFLSQLPSNIVLLLS